MISSLLFAFLLACNNTKTTDTSDIDAFTPCSATIESTYPLPNSENVYYRDNLSFSFSEEISGAEISLTAADGTNISGQLEQDGTSLSFIPSSPLQPSTSYQASLSYCGSAEPVLIDFKTTDLGTPLANGNTDLLSKTYAVDLESGVILEPAGVGELLRAFLSNTFLIHVIETTDSSISVRSALSTKDSVEQNFCVSTLDDFPIIDMSQSPYFSLENDTLQLNVSAYNVKIYQFRVLGTFASDASSFQQAYIAGELDAREAYTLLADFGIAAENEDDVCDLLDGFGAECLACSSDGAPYCLRIVIDDMVANAVDEIIYPVCQGDCHELCEVNLETCTEPQAQNETCAQ